MTVEAVTWHCTGEEFHESGRPDVELWLHKEVKPRMWLYVGWVLFSFDFQA